MNFIFNNTFFRYSLNGFFLNLLGFLTYLFLTSLNIDPKIAVSITYISFLIIGFFLHKKYSFISSIKYPSLLKYLIVHISAFLINLISIYFMVDIYGFKHQYVQALMVILVAIYLYLMLNKVVFRKSNKSNNNDSF